MLAMGQSLVLIGGQFHKTVEILRSPPHGRWELLPNLELVYGKFRFCAVALSATEFVIIAGRTGNGLEATDKMIKYNIAAGMEIYEL